MNAPSRFGLAAAGLLFLSGVASGQPAPWWDEPRARKEGTRVLERVRAVMRATERSDGGPAVEALRDSAWAVRLFAAVRLEVLGLDGGAAADLKRTALPGKTPLAANAPALVAARKFAAGLEQDPAGDREVEAGEAVRILASIVSEQVRSGPEQPPAKRRLVEELLTMRGPLEKGERAWLAGRILALTDPGRALADLKAKTTREAAGKDGQPVFAWYRANARFLYWHPNQRRFRLDTEARDAKRSSEEYREEHPWGPEEGPNSAPQKPGRGGR